MAKVHRTELFQVLDKVSRGIELWEQNKEEAENYSSICVFPVSYVDHSGCEYSGLWFGNTFSNRYALIYDASPMALDSAAGRYRIMFATNTELIRKEYIKPNGSGSSSSFPPTHPSESFDERDSFLVGVAIGANLCSGRDVKASTVTNFLDFLRAACNKVIPE